MNPPHVVIVASYVSELIFHVDHLMQPGETLAGKFSEGLGGKGFNMCIAARRCGVEVHPILKLGRDAYAEKARSFLLNEGIAIDHVSHTDDASGIGVILLGADGQNSIAVDPAANAMLGRAEMQAAATLIHSAKVVLAQLETPPAAALAAFQIARAAGVTTILNPAPAPANPLSAELLALTDILTPNESEAATLTGEISTGDWQQTAHQLRALGPKSIIITLGSRGVGLLHGDQATLIPAPAVEAVDTSGAGDAFNGALVARLAHGDDLESACRHAVRYASVQVTRQGTAIAMPNMAPDSVISTQHR